MKTLSIDTQIEKIIGSINALPEQVAQAAMFSLNRTAEWMKGQVSKELSAEKRLKLKVQIGKVKTNWLPIISMAGDTKVWIPITVGEQVAVVSPYGEMAQSFVIRSIHYNNFSAPENKDDIFLKTKANVKTESEGKLEALFKNGFELKANDTYIYVYGNSVKAKSGNAEITVAEGKISCNCASR